jgi:hypothetical protein
VALRSKPAPLCRLRFSGRLAVSWTAFCTTRRARERRGDSCRPCHLDQAATEKRLGRSPAILPHVNRAKGHADLLGELFLGQTQAVPKVAYEDRHIGVPASCSVSRHSKRYSGRDRACRQGRPGSPPQTIPR